MSYRPVSIDDALFPLIAGPLLIAGLWWLHAKWLLPTVIRANRRLGVAEAKLDRSERRHKRFFQLFLIGASFIYLSFLYFTLANHFRQ